MNERIDWRWFIASQFAFGIVAGIVVARHTPVRTLQYMPFAVRAGFEAGGLEHERPRGGAEAMTRTTARSRCSACAALVVVRAATPAGPAPAPSRVELRPEEVKDFAELYQPQLFGLSWPRRKRRSRPRARESGVPRHHRRRDAPERDVDWCSRDGNAGLRAQGGRNPHRRTNRHARPRYPQPLEPAGRARWRHAAGLSHRCGRRTRSRRTGISDVLRFVPRPGRQRRTERQLHRRRVVPRTGERSGPSHHRDCRAAGSRASRLAQLRRRPIAVEPGRVRRRGLARFAAARISGPALSGCGSTELKRP